MTLRAAPLLQTGVTKLHSHVLVVLPPQRSATPSKPPRAAIPQSKQPFPICIIPAISTSLLWPFFPSCVCDYSKLGRQKTKLANLHLLGIIKKITKIFIHREDDLIKLLLMIGEFGIFKELFLFIADL